ncbi:unnamed protein product [Mytilus edulis]|uniref:C-type lectin domain-containing protein n=1 Tax=Mytilus edulis TaxID=6550 RepID=A0A8S3VJS3_MYTED|nr:unnamed protein product [Mytilus edulis]
MLQKGVFCILEYGWNFFKDIQIHITSIQNVIKCFIPGKKISRLSFINTGFIPETTTTAKITTASADRIPEATTTLKITTASVDLIPETKTTPELTTTSVDLIPEATTTLKITTASVDVIPETTRTPELTTTSVDLIPETTSTSKITTTSVDFIPETTTTSKITTDSVDFIPETTTSKITTASVDLIPETKTTPELTTTSLDLIPEATSTSKITITSVDFIPETTTTSNIKTDSVDFIPETTTSKITDSVDSIPETTTTSIDFLSTETSIPTSQSTSRQVSCDPDWILVGASCYRITPPDTITKQQWKNASEICKDNGGYLATLETAEENQLVKDYVGTLGKKDYFIGGSDLQTEGTFLWEHSGVIVNLHGSGLFYDWMSLNQPDNGNGNQHCMILAGRYGHMWNDVQCTVARAFIYANETLEEHRANVYAHGEGDVNREYGMSGQRGQRGINTDGFRYNNPHTVSIRPEPYDGGEDWEEYISHFEVCAELGRWRDADKVLALAAALRGPARTFYISLEQTEKRDYGILTQRLGLRFGSTRQQNRWLSRLEMRKRNPGEAIAALADDLRQMAQRAYIDLDARAQEVLALNQLYKSVTPEVKYQCTNQGCRTVAGAVEVIERYEAIIGDGSEKKKGSVRMTTDTHLGEASNFSQEPSENQFHDSINGLTRRIIITEGLNGEILITGKLNASFVRAQVTYVDIVHFISDTSRKMQDMTILEDSKAPRTRITETHKVSTRETSVPHWLVRPGTNNGSTSSILNYKIYRQLADVLKNAILEPSTYKLFDVNGNPLCSYGTLKQKLTLGTADFNTEFLVCDIKQDAILGQDFLLDHIDKIDYKRQILSTKDTDIRCWIGGEANAICRVIVKETVTLPGKSKMLIPVIIENAEHLGPLGYVDKTQKKETEHNITRGILDPHQEDIRVQLINFREEPITVHAKEQIGVCESYYEMPAVGVCNYIGTEGTSSDKLPSHIEDLFNRSIVHLQEKEKQHLKELLQAYSDVFCKISG